MSRLLVVLPSYNESENIIQIVNALLNIKKKGLEIYVCVVDDNSPDGTPEVLQNAHRNDSVWQERVFFHIREKKDGRGGAVRFGLVFGINSDKDFEYFVEMDCDFSHPPKAILEGISLLEGDNDVVLGSRYPDGTIEGWTFSRKFFSLLANQLARTFLSRKIYDYTNGFRFYTRKMVELLVNYEQSNKGFIYLSETLSLFLSNGAQITEFPIHFRNRKRGHSNTNMKEVIAALKGIIVIGIKYRSGKL